MTAYLLLNHLLNFMAPAMLLALWLVAFSRLFSRFFGSKRALVHVLWVQVAINFIVGAAALAAGLVLFGHDGKMLTYLALVLATALSQWSLMGGWKQ
ncbi:MAG: hypothetical protein ABIR35_09835 [Polaromonas sp.]